MLLQTPQTSTLSVCLRVLMTGGLGNFLAQWTAPPLALRLVATEPVVEVLARRCLGPLRLRRLLAASEAASALRRRVAHRGACEARRRSRVRAAKVTLLAAELGCV